MLWPFVIGGIGLALLGLRVRDWTRHIPRRNEDFDAMSAAAYPDHRSAVSR